MSSPENTSPRVAARRLPPHPSLEQLRKQSKELLERYRDGDADAVDEVHRFERDPDPSRFALHDAQRVLARAYGYESWAKLKAFVDRATVGQLAEAVNAGDMARARLLLQARPELVGMDMAANNEQRALHYAVLRRDAEMVRLLMEAGANARQGVWPHRDATTAYAIASEREYREIVAIIEEEEQRRREEMSCPNATVSAAQEQINDAIREGDDETAMRLLEADRSLIQACDREGGSPLHVAAGETNVAMVEWLLRWRANPRKEDVNGMTPLDRVAMAADPQFPAVARLLLDHGAPLTVRGAVALGDADVVRTHVAAHPGVLREMTWRTGGLVTLAVKNGQLGMVRLLLDLGADVDERTLLEELDEPVESWGAPLWHAALAGQRDIVELLLDRGADPNANVYASGWPLRNAWRHEDDSVKRLLLERGAKPQPYMIAEVHDVAEARRMLEADPTNEELARELAWSAGDHGCPEIVEMALAHLDWAPDDPQWHWVLMQPMRGVSGEDAEREGFFACMEILLRRADPNVSRMGQTALHFVAANRGIRGAERARFAGMLIDHGAWLDARDELLRSTPLGWACRWGRVELVEMLIARGAPVEELDAEPWATPLAWARKMGRADVVAVLLATDGHE